MLINTWFSSNALSPDKGLGAFEPKAEKASKGGGPSLWLCQRRGREWPSLFIHNFFSLGVAQLSPKAPRFHRGIWGEWVCCILQGVGYHGRQENKGGRT